MTGSFLIRTPFPSRLVCHYFTMLPRTFPPPFSPFRSLCSFTLEAWGILVPSITVRLGMRWNGKVSQSLYNGR